MADADDFDVESLRKLLRGESAPAPAPKKKPAVKKPAVKKATAKKPAARRPGR